MSKWKMVKIKDACEKASSNIAQKDICDNDGEYPIYGASGFIKAVDFYVQEKEYIGIVKDGAGVGRVMLLPPKSSVIGTIQYIIPNERVSARYLANILAHLDLGKLYSGATIPHIYFKNYENIEIPLPPIEEQKRIVDILDKASNLIDLRKQQLEKMDLLIKSKFIDMFGDPVTNPKGWEIEKLGKHISVIGGYAFKSNGFSAHGIPVLRIGNINSGFFKSTNLVFWNEDQTLARYMLKPGDMIISLTGTVGKDDYGNICILGNDYSKYYLNQRNAKLELKNTIDKRYLSNILKMQKIKSKLTDISRGVRQANIANADILNLSIPIPPVELQNQFAAFVEQVEKQKVVMQQSLGKMETNYKALMQEYF